VRTSILLPICFLGLAASSLASPVYFPVGFVPFTSIYYVSGVDSSGDRLIEGNMTINSYAEIESLTPSASNQQFADASVQLAPGRYFSNVYIPTANELQGNFMDVPLAVYDPINNTPFAYNIVPLDRLFYLFAFRVGPTTSAAPEPSEAALLALSMLCVAALGGVTRSKASLPALPYNRSSSALR
jgi:hypothetical protein